MRILPPARQTKSDRCVSMRAEVQPPLAPLMATISRLPFPLRCRLLVLPVYVWISPVPQLAGPPG